MSLTTQIPKGLSIRQCLDLGIDPMGLVFKDSQTDSYDFVANCNPEGTKFVFVSLGEIQRGVGYRDAIHKCGNTPEKDKYWMTDMVYVQQIEIPSNLKFSLEIAEMNVSMHAILGDGKRYSLPN